MDDETIFDLRAALTETYGEFSRQLVAHVPQLLGAILLLLAGWVVAYLLQLATRKLIGGLDVLFSRFSRNPARHKQIQASSANLISKLVFWTVLIFFFTAAAKMLGWELFSGWLQSLIRYLPSLVTGIVIILIGFLVANAARPAIASTAASAGVAHSEMLAHTVQIVIIFTAVVIGVEQIGINVSFLTTIMVVIAGVLLAGGALAFALGANTLVANMIGAQFARKNCRTGEILSIAGHKGELVEITQTTLVLETAEGRALIPAKLFHEQTSLMQAYNSDDTGDKR
jgi:small-conductance mechanosensitive channel